MSDAPRYKKYVDIGGLLLAFVGIGTYFYGEYLKDQREREGEVLVRVERLQTDPILEMRLAVLEEFSDVKSQAFLLSGPTEGEITRFVQAKSDKSETLLPNIIRLIYFFDELQTCIDTSQCSSEKASSWMKHDAHDVHRLFGGFIEHYSKHHRLPRLGCGLTIFATGNVPKRCESASSLYR